MSLTLKGKIYKAWIRPVAFCGSECWTMKELCMQRKCNVKKDEWSDEKDKKLIYQEKFESGASDGKDDEL